MKRLRRSVRPLFLLTSVCFLINWHTPISSAETTEQEKGVTTNVQTSATSTNAVNVPIKTIDRAKLQKCLPKGWIIGGVTVVDAPHGWARTMGGSGIRVSLTNPDVTIHDQMVGDYHPGYSFTLLPLDWEGTNVRGEFRKGKMQKRALSILQIYPDMYRKRYPSFYYFESYLGVGPWSAPFQDVSKYFEDAH